MPTKIRLQRHGKKKYAYFHVVIADSRAPRDGKFIEKLGTYNPNTNPASIDINFDRALNWVKQGAQPTDTVRALLSYKGVLYKNHLDIGVKKGAFSQEDADKKFDDWLKAKEAKIESKKDSISADAKKEADARLAAEAEANKKKADSIAAKNSDLAAEASTAEASTEVATEDAPATEAVAEEAATTEAAVEEAPTEETPAAEAAATEEAPAKEAKEETPAEEAPATEASAEETASEEAKEEEKKEEAAE